MRLIYQQIVQIAFIYLICQLLSSCGSHLYHVVERGETLYSISWMYGHDYQKVAQWNQLKPPYVIKEGQRLRVATLESDTKHAKMPKVGKFPANSHVYRDRVNKPDSLDKVRPGESDRKNVTGNATFASEGKRVGAGNEASANRNNAIVWQWPAGGKVVERFDPKDPGKRGVDIEGRRGQPVYAASRGKVVYSGSGLPRYGKLIIVKHSDTYLSAYAHNKALHVREGDSVQKGQHIADMGSSGASSTKLHFEIRRNGKAVDPLRLLPKTRP